MCESHGYSINVVNYLLIIGVCGLFSRDDLPVHHCQHTFAVLTIAVYKPILMDQESITVCLRSSVIKS